MEIHDKIEYIKNWIKGYANENNFFNLVIGISGGIDSALTSTLCCMTELNVHALNMPIHSADKNTQNSRTHCKWLEDKFNNVTVYEVDLSQVYNVFKNVMSNFENNLGLANSKARLRMTTLYQVASSVNGLVVGTGNKVEDFGVGFYTKYGDGGVDISPIADLYKTEVYEYAKQLDVHEDILNVPPTDGLWEDNRTDQDQLKASYKELEECMKYNTGSGIDVYNRFRKQNMHKMTPIPVCTFIDEKLKRFERI